MTITHGPGGDYVQIYSPGHPKYRLVAAFKYNLTWDHTPMTCYYVGNKQGGGIHPVPSESVIEGDYDDYIMVSLYDTSLKDYGMFNNSIC